MQNTTDEQVAELAAEWPSWEFWIVHRYIGGPLYCARRRDSHRKVLNADTPAQLTEYLEDAVGS